MWWVGKLLIGKQPLIVALELSCKRGTLAEADEAAGLATAFAHLAGALLSSLEEARPLLEFEGPTATERPCAVESAEDEVAPPLFALARGSHPTCDRMRVVYSIKCHLKRVITLMISTAC